MGDQLLSNDRINQVEMEDPVDPTTITVKEEYWSDGEQSESEYAFYDDSVVLGMESHDAHQDGILRRARNRVSTSDDGRRQIARPSTSRSYSKWSTTERNKIIDHILNSPKINWALNSSVTALAMKGLVLEGRTTDQIRKKALEILKKFKISYKKRNSTGNVFGLPVVHRYEELAKACGNLVQLPLLMGSEGNKRTGGGDRKRNLPPTPGRSRPLSSPHPIPRYGQELGQLEDSERLQNGQDYVLAVRDLEERQADRLLRERELEERVKLRQLKEKQLQFEIRKWESGRE